MQGFQYDVVIDDIIDEVMEPQLRPVIIEAWRDIVDVDRNKQVKKVRARETYQNHDKVLLFYMRNFHGRVGRVSKGIKNITCKNFWTILILDVKSVQNAAQYKICQWLQSS